MDIGVLSIFQNYRDESDDGAVFRCTVSNLVGAVVSAEATLHVTSNAAPVVTIATPEVDARYAAGDTIHFSGQADDAEDGVLAEGALTWWIDFHHDTHAHPAMPATTGLVAETFVIPNDGETATDVWYRVSLEARDAHGRSTRIDRDVHPRLSALKEKYDPEGLFFVHHGVGSEAWSADGFTRSGNEEEG